MTRRLLIAAPLTLATALFVGCSSESGEQTPDSVDTTTNAAPAMPLNEADLVSLTYSVNGLHCENCVASVTETVVAMPGVAACDVSLEEGRMIVRVDGPDTGDAVADAVRAMNYTVAPLPADAAETDEDASGA